jgi:hypothetical protein
MQFWMAGTKEEIEDSVQALRANGFTFHQGNFHEFKFSAEATGIPYYCPLNNLRPPAVPTPQPRPWDAVLGGFN